MSLFDHYTVFHSIAANPQTVLTTDRNKLNTTDHLLPRWVGGLDGWYNLVTPKLSGGSVEVQLGGDNKILRESFLDPQNIERFFSSGLIYNHFTHSEALKLFYINCNLKQETS